MNFTNLVKTTLSGFFCALGTMLLFLSFSPDNSTSPIQLADIGAICDLSIEVSTEPSTVCVPPLPPAEDNCDCNGKMQNLTLEYNGPAGATVTVYDDYGTLIATFANVQPGDILFVSAENLNDEEFEAWTSFYTNGGDVTWLHTSCSQNILGDTEGDFTVLGYTDGQGDQCGILGNENYQGCNGSADLTVSNGESPYTYLWSDGSISGDRNDLCAGEYEVTVTDANGCSSTADVVVESDTPEILISVETEANTVCDDSPNPNDCDCQGYIYEFEVEYNGASGILGGAYDYHDNTYLHDTLVTGQVYTFNVSNSNHPGEDHEHNDPMMWTYEGGSWIHHGTIDASCPTSIIGTSYGPFTVLGYTDVHGNVCSTATNCNGSADLTVSNGEAPYTYLWSDGSTSGDRDDLCAGEYQVTVTDANGCSTEIDVEITSDTQDVTAVADVTADAICPEFDVCDVLCFESSNGDDDVSAQMSIDIEEGPNTITLRTIYAKTFCDNTYGDNTIGWPGNHSFGNLRGSDKLELALYNENGDLSLQFELDYIDDEGQGPSGYGTGGVSEGDGDMIVGNEAYILDVKTSLSENFNTYGYVLTENSPATDADYTSNPDYPNWIYEVWYEVTIDLDAFGNSGFGYPEITDFHASPSKTGNNSEPVEFSECCGNGGVECTGSIDLTVTEGVAPFTFAWSNGETTEDIYNLCGGSYSVVVTDANGCSAEYTYEVTCNSTCEIECVNDLTLDCEASTDPNHTGYPTLVCGGYGDCDREAGEFDFAFHGWGGTPVGWGFGPGWQIGTGCDPECGNIPNVFIDFTNFHTDYDTKLKSPIYDACCTDNVYLSFCMQQDLYGGEDVPGFLDVQYRLNGGTWETVYTYNNVFGSTVNYNDTFEIPGAAGNAFEVRFRARGEGSSEFTLGGWGIDDVRVFGHSSGCDSPEEVDIDWSYSDSSNGSCPEVITRTFTGEYNGETFSCIQTLTIVDEEAPIFTSVPDDEEYPCSESIDPSSASAIDNCDDYVTITQSDQIIGFGCTYYIERTFVATDYCGNTASYIQTITINDTEAPEIDCPADVTVECTESLDPSNTGEATATDDCSTPMISYVDGPMMGECPATFERTWTATDACGNSISCVQVITIDDTVAPVLSGEDEELTLDCNVSPTIIPPTATDNCDDDVEITSFTETIPGECPQERTDIYTWTATDDCGNTAVRTLIFNYIDTIAPILIGVPADTTIDCNDEVPDAIVMAVDNCDDAPVVSLTAETEYHDCGYDIIRTWTAIDACGNTYSESQTLNVIDITAPEIECPADYVVNCDNGSSDPEFAGEPVVTDNCSEFDVTYSDGEASDDCPATFERTWTATDACGNSSSCIQIITINDSAAPVITCPADVTVECTESLDPSNTGEATAEDDCSTPNVTYVDGPMTGDCPYTVERTWTAVDPCGNETSCVQTITIEDTVAPVLTGEDEELDLECNISPSVIAPEVSDNCDMDIELVFNIETIEGDCPNQWTDIYTWTAMDACGNTTVRTLTFNFDDTQAPIFDFLPENFTVECDQAITLPVVTATDNCSDPVVVMTEEEFELPCGSLIERTWTATDACGNSVSHTQAINVVDTTAPVVVSAPLNVTIECDQPEPTEQPVFSDNCDDELTLSAISGIVQLDCGYEIQRSWTATDDCGNATTVSQTITVVDTTAPVLEGVPADATVECSDIPAVPVVTATDNCDDMPVISFSEVNTGGCPYNLVRTWTAVDNCGNQSTMTQTLTVIDNEAPVLVGVPADFNGECGLAPEAGMVTATDNCDDDVTVTMIEEVQGDSCPLTIVRTWTAVDNCGNSVSDSQTITINDETAPVFTAGPADETVECDMVMGPDNDAIEVEDNCDTDVVITYGEVIIPGEPIEVGGVPCGYEIVRTWTATDDCNNMSTYTQTVTVVDTTAPVLMGVPADVTVECTDLPAAPVVTAMDNCFDGQMNVMFDESTNDLDCGYEVVRTWSASDNCGNMTSETQTITVTDTTAPVVVMTPQDVTIECDEALPTANAVFTDDCDDSLSLTINDEEVDQDCGYYIIRTWTATDDCGNEASTSQSIFVTDTTAPVLVGVPADATVECSDIPAAPIVTATDNCDDIVVPTMVEEIISGDCPYTIERTWTAVDECGNTTESTQVLTVLDETAPVVVSAPMDVTIECDQPEPTEQPVFSDNCDDELTLSAISGIVQLDCGYEIQRTWSATDDCGNSVSVSQTITVVDTTAPVVTSTPADLDLECDEEVPFVAATFSDNCDVNLEVDYNENFVAGECENTYTLERTWTAMDDCGNMISTTQTINVSDTTVPILVGVPADATAECDQVLGAADVTATDNCDLEVTVTLVETTEDATCGYVITRTWTAVDNCGNMDEATQTITVVDTTAPVAEFIPAMITVECDEEIQDASPIFSDNCDELLDIVSNEITEDLDCGSTITRTWTATDDCGNEVSTSQTITVVDTTDPVLIGVPADVTAECDDVPAAATVTADDNCAENLEVFFAEGFEATDCGYILTRIWSTSDECGNTASATQIVTVVDTTAPVVVSSPADVTIECDQPEPTDMAVFSDNCDDELTLEAISSINMLDCGYEINRTWFATDDCGNTTSVSQTITVVDTTAPVIIDGPADATVQCDEVPGNGMLNVEDNCDELVDVDVTETTEDQECGYIITRTYTAMDDCGNTAVHVQTITVTDTEAPIIVGVPADETIECGDTVPGPGQVDVTDNCDPMPMIISSEMMEDLECGYQIIRTYVATDECGNMSEATQTITVSDFTAPVFDTTPEDITVNCDEVTIAPSLTATDNCDDLVEVTLEEVIGDGCPYTITRTWTAIDECGNTATIDQVVTVIDEVAPVFDPFEVFVALSCDEVDDYIITATDNCGPAQVAIIEELLFSGGCYGTLQRTYEATDECGNSVTATQLVQIIDTTAPELFNVPADVEITCGEDIPAIADDVFATDNCTAEVEIEFEEVQSNEFCPYTITRTWTAIDICGNVTEGVQVIDVTVEVPEQVALVTYPNPFNDKFTVEFSVPRDADVIACVYDMSGREVMPIYKGEADARRLYSFEYANMNWEAGTYILMITVGDEVYHHKMIVTQR